MGARNLTVGILLFVAILNNIQALKALPKRNSSRESQGKISLDFRQIAPDITDEEYQVLDDLHECASKWRAKFGDPCSVDQVMIDCRYLLIALYYSGNAPWSEFKKFTEGYCQEGLICSGRICQCEGEDQSSCKGRLIQRQRERKNCIGQSKAYLKQFRRLILRNIGSGVSDPGQNIPYIVLMVTAVILIVLIGH